MSSSTKIKWRRRLQMSVLLVLVVMCICRLVRVVERCLACSHQFSIGVALMFCSCVSERILTASNYLLISNAIVCLFWLCNAGFSFEAILFVM